MSVASKSSHMKADARASYTYPKSKDAMYLRNVCCLINGPSTTLPDTAKIQASCQENLHLHKSFTPKDWFFPKLNNESLLLIGQLCDENYMALFDKKVVYIFKDDKIILQGKRNLKTGFGIYNSPQIIKWTISSQETRIKLK